LFRAASACLLVCGGLSVDAGALAIRSAEQPGGWGQCGGVLLRHEPPSHPRTQRMKIGFRITTAARRARPQAPQRPSDLRTSATVIFQRQGHKKKISPSP